MGEPQKERCWVCGAPAVWKMSGERQDTASLRILFWTCDRCAPFALLAPAGEKEQ